MDSTRGIKMNDEKEIVRNQWLEIFNMAIEDFRNSHPDSLKTDKEILDSLCEHFVETGTIIKKDGKYVLPKIIPSEII
jgi:hypothetical protein